MSQATSTATSLSRPDEAVAAAAEPLPAASVLHGTAWIEAGSAGSADLRESARIDLVYQEYIERIDAGEDVDPDEFCARYPSLATSLRSLLRAHSYVHKDCPELVERLDKLQWPEVGTSFLGFELQRQLGRGTFARVYLATEPALGNRRVAVKVSCQGKNEAQTLGRLDHPQIVPVHSVREDPQSDLTAVCMPYLGNATLSDVLDYVYGPDGQRTRASVFLDAIAAVTLADEPAPTKGRPAAILREGSYTEGVVYLGRQLARALAYVHERGICHGDLKPSNVLMGPEGQPLLLDFNLALAEQIANPRIGGTLPYMSPEQLRATDTSSGIKFSSYDARADLFSLGVMLYELLSGKHPFGPVPLKLSPAELRAHLTRRHQQGLVPLGQVCPGIDAGLACLIERCLAIDPANRPQTAREVETELRRYLAPLPRLRRWAGQHQRTVLAAVGALLLATSAAAVVAYRSAPAGNAIERHFQQGNREYQQGRVDQAIEHYQAALLLDPKFARARYARARAFLQNKLYTEAITDFQVLNNEANRLDGRYLAGLGYAFMLKRDNPSAIVGFREALEQGYATAGVYNDLGYCLIMSGDPDKSNSVLAALPEAFEHLGRAIALDPQLQAAYINRALATLKHAHLQVGIKVDNGIADAETALKIGPASARLHRIAAHLHARAALADEKHGFEATLGHLAEALALGDKPDSIARDVAFGPIKNDRRFQALVQQAGQPEALPPVMIVDPLGE